MVWCGVVWCGVFYCVVLWSGVLLCGQVCCVVIGSDVALSDVVYIYILPIGIQPLCMGLELNGLFRFSPLTTSIPCRVYQSLIDIPVYILSGLFWDGIVLCGVV